MAGPYEGLGLNEDEALALIEEDRRRRAQQNAAPPPSVPAQASPAVDFRQAVLANPQMPQGEVIDLRPEAAQQGVLVPDQVRPGSVHEVAPGPNAARGSWFSGLMGVPADFSAFVWDLLGQHDIAEDARQTGERARNDTDRFLRNVGTGILSLPGDVAGMFGLAAAGVDFVSDRLRGDDADLGSYLFRDGGQEALEDHLDQVFTNWVNEQRAAGIEPTEEAAQQFMFDYEGSDDYYRFLTTQLRDGLNISAQITDWARRAAGDDRNPNQMTALDEAEQLIGGAFVGLPEGVVRSFAGRIAADYIEQVSRNVGARIALRTAEALTPLTLPLTPANVAINAGAGIAINEVIRDTAGMDGLFDDAPEPNRLENTLIDEDEVPLATTFMDDTSIGDVQASDEAAALGVSATLAAGLLGAMFGRYVPSRHYTPGGPSFAEQVNTQNAAALAAGDDAAHVTPGLGTPTAIRNVTNADAPITDAVRAATGNNQDAVDRIDSILGLEGGVSSQVALDNFNLNGILPDSNIRTTPPSVLRRMWLEAPADVRNLYNDGVQASQVRFDREVQRTRLQSDINDLNTQMIGAMTQGNQTLVNRLAKKLAELNQREQRMAADLPDTRASMEGLSNADLDALVKQAKANPDVDRMMKITKEITDGIVDWRVHRGDLSQVEGMRFKRDHATGYVPLKNIGRVVNDPKTGELRPASSLRKAGQIWKERILGNANKETNGPSTGYRPDSSRDISDISADTDIKVNQPLAPLEALGSYINSTIRNVQSNHARRSFFDEIKGTDWQKRHARRLTIKKRDQFTPAEVRGNPEIQTWLKKDNVISVKRGGNYEFYEIGDPVLHAALQLSPPTFINALNWMRKVWQSGVTGLLAPWFAPTAAIWEGAVGSVTRRPGRSFGMIDLLLRRIYRNDERINRLRQLLPLPGIGKVDPTAYLQMLGAVPRSLLWRSYGALGKKISNDLQAGSGFFSFIGSMPTGKRWLNQFGANIVRQFDQSAVGTWLNSSAKHTGFLSDAFDAKASYDKALGDLPALLANAPGLKLPVSVVRNTFKAYKTVLDAIHSSGKEAFFAQNYSLLKAEARRNGGKGAKPDAAKVRQLINETRTLSGDVSKVGGSRAYNAVASVIPYSNVTVQSTKHLLASTFSDGGEGYTLGGATRGISAIAGGVFLPAIATVATINYMGEEAQDYYWNQMPTWQRTGVNIIPTPEGVIKMLQGEPLTFDDVYQVRIAPEFIPFHDAAIAGMQMLGMVGGPQLIQGARLPIDFSEQMRTAATTLLDLAMPPAVNFALARAGQTVSLADLIFGEGVQDLAEPTFGGVNSDKMNVGSRIDRVTADAVGALFGTIGQIGMQAFDAFDQARNQEQLDFDRALSQAVDTAQFEVSRRVPDVPLLFNNGNTYYKFSAEAEEIGRFLQIIDPVLNQRNVQNDAQDRQGMAEQAGFPESFPVVQDPMVQQMIEITHKTFGSGRWLQLNGEMANINSMITRAQEPNSSLTAQQRAQAQQLLTREYQSLNDVRYGYLTSYLGMMESTFGDYMQNTYQMPWSPENMVQVVRALAQPVPFNN